MCCNIPNKSRSTLSSHMKASICKLPHISLLRDKYIQYSCGIVQPQNEIQLIVFPRLDIPHGHIDMLKTNFCNIQLILVVNILKKGIMIQHITYESEKLKEMFKFILKRLLKKNKSDRALNNKRQQIYEDKGFNSGQSHSRRRHDGTRITIPYGIAIPDSNIRKGINEEEVIHDILHVLPKSCKQSGAGYGKVLLLKEELNLLNTSTKKILQNP